MQQKICRQRWRGSEGQRGCFPLPKKWKIIDKCCKILLIFCKSQGTDTPLPPVALLLIYTFFKLTLNFKILLLFLIHCIFLHTIKKNLEHRWYLESAIGTSITINSLWLNCLILINSLEGRSRPNDLPLHRNIIFIQSVSGYGWNS